MIVIKRGQPPILIVNVIAIIVFSFLFLSRQNYEFLIYIGVIIFFLLVLLFTNSKVEYPNFLLWLLTVWSLLHMAGGGIIVGSDILYTLILIPIIGEPYFILKYDQFVHTFGFFAATVLAYYVIKPHLKKNFSWSALSFTLIMAGLGLGALNEIIEFIATVLVPETNVGGYINTSLDLVFDLLGAIIAVIVLYFKER